MTSAETHVVVGTGLAGGKAVEALREQGFDGRIVLIGSEPHRPYERPPLSKGYLMGSAERESVFVHAEDWYSEHAVEHRGGIAATGIDRGAAEVELADGERIPFDKLLLATGAAPRRLPIPGTEADGVLYLRTLDESEALRARLVEGRRLAVIGAGWIGLEVAAAARAAGAEVTVFESAELPLLRVLGPEVARVFAELHREHGVELRFGADVASIATEDASATGVVLGDGRTIEADSVLVAVGIAPSVSLAESAGLEVDNGIVVDDALRTADPRIVAAGDAANAWHPLLRKRIRVEHWANALNQPAVAAATMLGKQASYDALPYFFTDQYDLGMEYVGYVEPGGYDQVVIRGDLERREFIAFWLAGGRVLAGMNVNVWDVVEDVKGLIRSGSEVNPERLGDPDVPLGEVLG